MRQCKMGYVWKIYGRLFAFCRGFVGLLFAMSSLQIVGLASSIPVCAQEMVLGYAGALGGGGDDYGRSIAVDNAGNIYATGTFEGTMDLDPGPGVFNLTSQGASDTFVCKLDASGDLLWAFSLGGIDYDVAQDIALDSSGHAYITGLFRDVVDFDPGIGLDERTSAGRSDMFLCKIDTAGNIIWTRTVGGPDYDHGVGVAVDGADNVYVAGGFLDTVDFDPGPGVTAFTSGGGTNIFTEKFDSDGEFQWVSPMLGGAGSGRRVAIDNSGNVYATGIFFSTTDFDPGPGTYNLTSNGEFDVFVCKLDSAGNLDWAIAQGGSLDDHSYGIAVTPTGQLCVTGVFQGSADFDGGPGVFSLTSAGQYDGFISMLDSSGNLQWAGAFGGSDDDYGRGVAFDATGVVYGTGSFRVTADLDPGPGVTNVTSAGGDDVYVFRLDASGSLVWAKSFGGSDSDEGSYIATDIAGNIYGTGWFGGGVDFDPGPGELLGLSAGGLDAFYLKLEPQYPPMAADDIGETNADEWLTTLTSPVANSVLANDSDANTRYTLTVSAHDATSVLGAVVVVNRDGTFLYDPAAVAVLQALAPGDSMLDSFTYTLSDGTDTALGSVTVTVNGKGTSIPALSAWGCGLLCLSLAGAGYWTRRSQR